MDRNSAKWSEITSRNFLNPSGPWILTRNVKNWNLKKNRKNRHDYLLFSEIPITHLLFSLFGCPFKTETPSKALRSPKRSGRLLGFSHQLWSDSDWLVLSYDSETAGINFSSTTGILRRWPLHSYRATCLEATKQEKVTVTTDVGISNLLSLAN